MSGSKRRGLPAGTLRFAHGILILGLGSVRAQTPNSVADDGIRAFRKDRTGILWIGSRYGLDSLDPASVTGVDHSIQLVARDDGCGMDTKRASEGRPGHPGLPAVPAPGVTIPLRDPRKTGPRKAKI